MLLSIEKPCKIFESGLFNIKRNLNTGGRIILRLYPITYNIQVLLYFPSIIIFNSGRRLNATVLKSVHAYSGVHCIAKCSQEDTSCRSVNFKKNSESGGENGNCELLKIVGSEHPVAVKRDENFEHYMLLKPDRVSTISNKYS